MSDETTTPTPDPAPSAATEEAHEVDYQAEADKWKAMARKHEQQAKGNAEAAKELAAIKEAQKTAEEKAAGRAAELERKAAAAELKALRYEVATETGLPAKLIPYLRGDTADEMQASAAELIGLLIPKIEEGKPELPPTRPKEALKPGNTKTEDQGLPQLSRDDLKRMTPEQIVKAKEQGQLDAVLGVKQKD